MKAFIVIILFSIGITTITAQNKNFLNTKAFRKFRNSIETEKKSRVFVTINHENFFHRETNGFKTKWFSRGFAIASLGDLEIKKSRFSLALGVGYSYVAYYHNSILEEQNTGVIIAKVQNTKEEEISFTFYDYLGRIRRVGKTDIGTNALNYFSLATTLVTTNIPYINTFYETTETVYGDNIYGIYSNLIEDSWQKNLKGRVALVLNREEDDTTPGVIDNIISITKYSYDEHGNVDRLLQLVDGYEDKVIDYEYDLLSGNVNKVYFQKNQQDQFIHKYEYDADNRITNVYTSRDNIIWDEDAEYFYYAHGPLARVEIGGDKIQSLDYYYTLHGWLKGINMPDEDNNSDLGKDGVSSLVNNLNSKNAQDEFALALGYYEGDYSPINSNLDLGSTTNPWSDFAANLMPSAYTGGGLGLHNGNIAWQMTNLAPNWKIEDPNDPGNKKHPFLVFNSGESLSTNTYKYDQLNRIISARSYLDYSNNNWENRGQSLNSNYYDADYSYDANGNLMTLARSSKAEGIFDDFTYNYNNNNQPYLDGNGFLNNGTNGFELFDNKLGSVSDAISTIDLATDDSDMTTDIESGMSVLNYDYDEIGNLTQDLSEEIESIEWTVYGKVSKVIREIESQKENIKYLYDAMGNRIAKFLIGKQFVSGSTTDYEEVPESEWIKTFYTRDASGNILATYTDYHGESPNITEYSIYGSSRLGTQSFEEAELQEFVTPDTEGIVPLSINYDLIEEFIIEKDKNFLSIGDVIFYNSIQYEIAYIQSVTNTSGSDIYLCDVIEMTNFSSSLMRGRKSYELSNHLGNVMVVVSDKRKGIEEDQLITVTNEEEDFESGIVYYSGGSRLHKWTKDAGALYSIEQHQGSNKLKVDANNNVHRGAHYFFPTIPGKQYTVSYDVELGTITTGLFTAMAIMQSSSGSTTLLNHPGTGAQQFTFTAQSAMSRIKFRGINRIFYLDNFKITTEELQPDVLHYEADVKSAQDYYPFGSTMPGRTYTGSSKYRFGFNGHEKEGTDWTGNEGSHLDFGARIYDSRLGRFFNPDPWEYKYSWQTPYAYFKNSPISTIDWKGFGVKVKKIL